jgi:pimeloyl-ACP methyl ester carboxylesterase
MLINLNGLQLHYEEYGVGKPLILLHGNGESIKIFDKAIPLLAEKWRVIALDSRDHGESQKLPSSEELRYDDMAQDTIALIEALDLKEPALYGFSDGGIVGLLVAIKAPNLLSSLIISGANLEPSGVKTWVHLLFRVMYFFTRSKQAKMMFTQPHITTAELARINIPVLVTAGSKDLIREDETRRIAQSLPSAKLQILPGEGHGSYIIHSDKIANIINSADSL